MPSRDEIKPKVIAKIAAVTDVPAAKIQEKDKLWEDLGMGPVVRQAMGVPYTKISKKYPKGLVVSMSAAGDCKTVKESVDLVNKRANGDAS